MKIFVIVLVALTIVGFAVYVRKNSPAPPFKGDDMGTLTEIGQLALDFETTMLDGEKVRLSDLRGKVVLTVFFATWCPPCQRELPMLEKQLQAEFKSDKFLILAIAREQTEADVLPFKNEHNLTFTLATDPNRIAFAKYATQGIPRTYLIAPDGEIAYQGLGYNEEDIPEIEKIVARLLKDL